MAGWSVSVQTRAPVCGLCSNDIHSRSGSPVVCDISALFKTGLTIQVVVGCGILY